jgi:hypothetical protein
MAINQSGHLLDNSNRTLILYRYKVGSGRAMSQGLIQITYLLLDKKQRECGLQITSGSVLSPNVYLALFPLDIDPVDFCLMGHRPYPMLHTFTYS